MTSQQQRIVRNKVGLLRLAEELGNVSRACKVMGYSRDTFYRYQQAVQEGGVEALLETSRQGRPNLCAFRLDRSAILAQADQRNRVRSGNMGNTLTG